MVSPRRSSRARSTAHAVTVSHSTSSHSSTSSSRSRHTRRRSEDTDLDASYQRVTEVDLDEQNEFAETDMADGDGINENESGDDEITRCVCGFQEYQGGDDDQTDTDGLFIQCDECSVWQHGFCVGIIDGTSAPDNYYCEKCKPELHKEGQTKAGMKTSIYLPTQVEQLKPTPISQKEANQKRRTTMNSRDAEYDDEVFKRMLELSKQDAKPNAESTRGSRGRKRGTSEGSDETSKESKRPRTSDSPETPSNAIIDSGDEKTTKGSASAAPSKKARNSGVRNSNNTASNGGKRISTRNRAVEKAELKKDDSEQSDDYSPRKNGRSNRSNPEEATATASTPVPEPIPDAPQQPKRTARNNQTNGNGRRRGNNRQTRQSEDPHDAASSMAMSRDQSSAGIGKQDNTASVLEKPTKPRLPAARMTLNEMKKRVSGISEYITRTQIEMATSRQSDIYAYLAWMEEKGTPVNSTTPKSSNSNAETPTSAPNGTSGDSSVPQIKINGSNGTGNVLDKASEALSSTNSGALDIMEILSTKINRWQQHYGEKL